MRFKLSLLALVFTQLCGTLFAASLTLNFDTAADGDNFFKGTTAAGSAWTWGSTVGAGGSGGLNFNAGANNIWILQGGFVPQVGKAYRLRVLYKNKIQNGYGGIGFTTQSGDGVANLSIYAAPANAIGFSAHGGGYVFHNNTATSSDVSRSWSPGMTTDTVNGNWVCLEFTLTCTAANTFSAVLKVFSVDQATGAIGALMTQAPAYTDNTNTVLGGATAIYPYFATNGMRFVGADSMMIESDGSGSGLGNIGGDDAPPAKTTPTVTISTGTYSYNGSPQGPGASEVNKGGSTGAVTLSYAGTSNAGATYGPSTVAPTNAGSYTVTASVATDSSYEAASSPATSFTISRATPTVTVSVGTYSYNGAAQGPAASNVSKGGSTGAVTLSYAGSSNAGVTYGPSAIAPTDAGSYTVTAAVAADDNYAAASSSATSFTISRANPTVTVSTGTYAYSGAAQGPGASNVNKGGSSGSLSLSYAGTSSDGVSYGPSSVPPTNAGSYTVTASVATDDNYASANSSATPFTISQSTTTVTVSVGTYAYNGSPQGPGASDVTKGGSSGAVTLSYAGSSNAGVAYGPSAVAPTDAGTYTVTAAVAADDNYAAASSSATSFTISRITPTVSVGVSGTYNYNGSPQGPDASTVNTGGSNGTITLTYSGTSINGQQYGPSTTPPTEPGDYTATASLAQTGNYNAATSAPAAFRLTRGASTITMAEKLNVNAGRSYVITELAPISVVVADSANGTLVIELEVDEGSLSLPSLAGATLEASSTTSLRLRGTADQLNAALRGLVYTPLSASSQAFNLVVLRGKVTNSSGQTASASTNLFVVRELLGGTAQTLSLAPAIAKNRVLTGTEVRVWDSTLFSSRPTVAADGTLTFFALEGQDGSVARTTLTVRMSYADGFQQDVEVPVTLYRPLLEVRNSLTSAAALNAQTSLYEQAIRIKNTTPFSLLSFSVSVPDLPTGVELKSASGYKADGTPYVAGITALEPGTEVTLILEYFSENARPFDNPTVKLLLFQAAQVPEIRGTALPSTSVRVVTGYLGRTYVQFSSTAGVTYWIQYRDSANAAWSTSTISVLGTGASVSWMDNGQPKTTSAPSSARSYQVIASSTGAALVTNPDPAPSSTPQPTPVPVTTSPATTAVASGGGGGGSPSLWMALATAALLILRRLTRPAAAALVAAASVVALPTTEAADYEQSINVTAFRLTNVQLQMRVHDFPSTVPSLAARSDRLYANGYNRVDSSNNLGEGAPGLPSRTSYFGYTSASQVNQAAGTLALNVLLPSSTTPYLNHDSGNSDVAPEFSYRLMRRAQGRALWGGELRAVPLSYTFEDSAVQAHPIDVLTDTYALGGVVPPAAPYSGQYQIAPFVPRIGDVPTRTVTTRSGTVAGRRRVQLDGWLVRCGGILRLVDQPNFQLELHGGAAWTSLDLDFEVREQFQVGSIPALSVEDRSARQRRYLGWYVGAGLARKITPQWSAVFSADWLEAGTHSVHGSAVSMELDLSQAITLNLGLAYHF